MSPHEQSLDENKHSYGEFNQTNFDIVKGKEI